MKIRSLHNAHINQHENVARAVNYISPLGSSQNMPPPCPTPSSASSAIPSTKHQSRHPAPIFASNINQVNKVNVARAVYYISPLGSSQNMPPLAQCHPPHPIPSPAPNTNPYTQQQSSHPISVIHPFVPYRRQELPKYRSKSSLPWH